MKFALFTGMLGRSGNQAVLTRSIAPQPCPLQPADLDQLEVDAQEFALNVEPRPGIDYAWVEDFARKAYDETARTAELQDTKSEKLIGFSATATTIILTLVGLKAADLGKWGITAIPAVVCCLTALWHGLRVHKPTAQIELPSIETAFRYAEDLFPDKVGEERTAASRAAFAAKIHEARDCQYGTIQRKATTMKRGYLWLFWALAFFILPVAAIVLIHASSVP